ncbi:MAG: DNA (cytosine-5-)-methyltransferase [Patescibacteria group bacterium]
MKRLRVAELFAGVGGFRVGFERASKDFDTVWFNQWEPGKPDSSQHAWTTYCRVFGHEPQSSRRRFTNTDISDVPVDEIPDHDLLVGGFPCQDYSVARTLSQAAGLVGKKGVLWWEIYRILREKGKKAPRYLMLENVDRLLKSPVSKRGRDFAIMLASLAELGYAIEWRVINAADYGMPQRRRRVYILGYKKGTTQYQAIKKDALGWLMKAGVMPKAFPIHPLGGSIDTIQLPVANEVESKLNLNSKASIFHNAGVMIDGNVLTVKIMPNYEGESTFLKHIVVPESKIPEEYFIPKDRLEEWRRHKSGKTEERRSKDGFKYNYSEGSMAFPDPLDKPSRTIVTGEGGSGASRFKHVIRTSSGRYRRLIPLELEKLNMFPENHTAGASDNQRAFFMGNALVVGIVERLGRELIKRADG